MTTQKQRDELRIQVKACPRPFRVDVAKRDVTALINSDERREDKIRRLRDHVALLESKIERMKNDT